MRKIANLFILMLMSASLFAQTKTGTLKLFSELQGVTIYIDESKQVTDASTFVLPIGTHYLKVLLGTATVYGDLVEIKENTVTTVLIKNTGQVQEKVMESKTPEREEYNNSKVDVILTSNAVSSTTGKSTYYPGFYGYYGYNKSNTLTTNVSDFKIIQGGVKEISDVELAGLAGNQSVLDANAKVNLQQKRQTNIGMAIFLPSFIIGGIIFVDLVVKKPFLHKVGTNPGTAECTGMAVGITGFIVGYALVMGADKHHPAHYYTPDVANADAQKVNKVLKQKLGLPESYDIK
jgi:hypothetical protein